jgi:hypothetical protein
VLLAFAFSLAAAAAAAAFFVVASVGQRKEGGSEGIHRCAQSVTGNMIEKRIR